MSEEGSVKPSSDGIVRRKLKPVCKPEEQLKKSRNRIFGDDSLKLLHSFGYQSTHGTNLCLMKEDTVVVIAGDVLVFLNLNSQIQEFLPSVNGAGFACVDVHPSLPCFAASEKGPKFCIHISLYPEFTLAKTLKSEKNVMAFNLLKFHSEEELLVSCTGYPENKMLIWQWKQQVVLYETTVDDTISSFCFTPANKKGLSKFLTSGEGKVKVWTVTPEKDDRDEVCEVAVTVEDGYPNVAKNTITCTLLLPDGYLLSATDEGFFIRWNLTSPEKDVEKISMDDLMPCHKNGVGFILFYDGFIISFGNDGAMKFWRYSDVLKELETDEVVEVIADKSSREKMATEGKTTDLEECICIEPAKTFLLYEKSSLVHAVLCSTEGLNITILIQDFNGGLWVAEVEKNLTDIYTFRLLFGAGMHLTNMTMCRIYPLAAVTSNLGDVIIFDCVNRSILCHHSFSAGATSLFWLDSKVDGVGASIIVGFSDGSVRWLSIAMKEEELEDDNSEDIEPSVKETLEGLVEGADLQNKIFSEESIKTAVSESSNKTEEKVNDKQDSENSSSHEITEENIIDGNFQKEKHVKERAKRSCKKLLVLQAVLKLHSDSIINLSMNSHSVMVSQGLDSKLFFTVVKDFSFKPLGFYLNHHQVNSFAWISHDEANTSDEKLLVFCKHSYFLEVDISGSKGTQNSTTFYIENKNCQVYKVNNLLQYRVLGDRIEDSDCEEAGEILEDAKKVLRKLKHEKKKEKRELREIELGIPETQNPPEILCYLPSTYSGHIWLSLGKTDYGYLFEFALTKDFKDHPIDLVPVRALEILTIETISVTAMKFSPCGHFIFMGLQDGSVNTCYLEKSFDPSSGYDFAKFQVNDPDFGSVKFIEVSPDGSFIVTAAADGNIFDIHFYAHRKPNRNYGTLPAISPEKIINIDDIMSPKVLSIEDDILHKLISQEKELKNQYLEQLDELKDQYIQFKERCDDYLNKCKLSLKRIDNIPKELLVDYQDISCSPTAAKLYTVENNAIILKMAKESEKEGVKVTLLKEKYVTFFKSRIKDEKVSVEDDDIIQSFRTCKIPTCVSNFKTTLYAPVYKKKIEKNIVLVESDDHPKTRTRRNDTLVNLEAKLARAMKDIIDYPEDTPISGIIRRYNERKQGMIKMLQQLISEVKFLDAIVPDEKCYEIAKKEIDALYFKFKDTHGLELVFPELLSTFSERRDNLLSYLKMINKFWDSFNDSVNEASQLKQLTDESILEPTNSISSETSSCLSERTQCMKEKHISVMKSSSCEMTPKLFLKIDWTPCKSKKSRIPLLGKRRALSPKKDMWSLKKFKSYATLLRTMKPKIDCEKKFTELRFIMKCIELNSLKGNLFAECNSLKNIEDLEGQLSIEKHEIQLIDEEITTLTNLRLLEKKKWMDLFKELMKFLGRKHKHKGYLKQLFKKKIGTESDIKKQRRHTSSENSDSEQNIDSEDDFESINSEGVSKELIEKVTEFRLKRHEVEMKMKEFKRKIRSTLVKKNAGARKIKKIEDLLIEAHKELDSLLIPRKTTWESLKWPVVLYPENVHLDFISPGVGHIENPKRAMEKEMVEINRNINADLIVVNNYIRASVFLLAARVVSLEISDLVDVVSAFLPVINAVSSSVDNYFESLLMDSESTEHTAISETFTDESYNIIKKILESVLDPKASEENDVATEEKKETSSSDKKDSQPSDLDIPLRDDKLAGLMQYKQKKLNLEKSKVHYSWKDVCEDVDLLGQNGITGSHDVFMEDFLSRAISHIDYKSSLDSTQNFIPDYYMLPFTYSVTEAEEVNLEEEITVTPEEEIRCVVIEVMENVLRLISDYENPVTQEKESIFEHKYPTYAGGGLMLNLSVLKEMEENSYDGYPFSSFYQEVKLMEDAEPVSKAERLKPDKNVETNAFSDYSLKSVSDFITVNIDAVLKLIQSYSDINVSISELGQQLSALKKKVLISKRPVQNKQDLIDEQQDLENTMKPKFGCVLDLDELLDAIDNPHILIKKHDFKTKMASLRNNLINLKAEEISAMQSLDALRLEDTKICYELVELRNLFRFFSKTFSSQHSILPKIAKTMKADTDPSGDFEN